MTPLTRQLFIPIRPVGFTKSIIIKRTKAKASRYPERAEEGDNHYFQKTENQTANHSPLDRSNTAENSGDKGLKPEILHKGMYLRITECPHNAAAAARAEPMAKVRAIMRSTHSHEPCGFDVFRDRPHCQSRGKICTAPTIELPPIRMS